MVLAGYRYGSSLDEDHTVGRGEWGCGGADEERRAQTHMRQYIRFIGIMENQRKHVDETDI